MCNNISAWTVVDSGCSHCSKSLKIVMCVAEIHHTQTPRPSDMMATRSYAWRLPDHQTTDRLDGGGPGQSLISPVHVMDTSSLSWATWHRATIFGHCSMHRMIALVCCVRCRHPRGTVRRSAHVNMIDGFALRATSNFLGPSDLVLTLDHGPSGPSQ